MNLLLSNVINFLNEHKLKFELSWLDKSKVWHITVPCVNDPQSESSWFIIGIYDDASGRICHVDVGEWSTRFNKDTYIKTLGFYLVYEE